MPEVAFHYSLKTFRVFIILIILGGLFSCSSHQPAPVTDKSRFSQWRPKTHTVAPGDTLFSIAWRYGLKYEDLARYNGIVSPYIIRPSQVIRLDLQTPASVTPGKTSITTSKNPLILDKKDRVSTNNLPVQRKENKTYKVDLTNKTIAKSDAPQWRWPTRGIILSSFQGNDGFNKGIDLGGKLGEPVLAAATGQVVYAGSGLRGYGKLLIIKHNETFLSAYAHNERLRVKEGDLVKAGQVIADMGSSGTDRVKLHFEIRRDGTPVDPLKYLPRR
ncbi:peptidoglycan DD-metalloendopeptidase family protein [Cellvibrio mixtus]|uniref:peptidoglycan DD-metalloendopeptidase family protein n=1 Tax=Cellvibrio mixtus TaxID=39650 RepID=UPI000693C080|nr:peptidoglycan DD-metalloendopeptidase family protein [Cellvibrio mixtus]